MILAIDASISSTGFAIVDCDTNLVEFGKLTTKSKEKEEDRIFYITKYIRDLIQKCDIKEVVMENQYLGRNPKTALQLSRLRGAIMFVATDLGASIEHPTPAEIRKKLMSNGSASKEEVAEYVRSYYKEDERVVALGEFNDRQCKAKNSDIYDAISIGLAYTEDKKRGL